MINIEASNFICTIVLRIKRIAIVKFLTFASVFLISYGENAIVNMRIKKISWEYF